MTRIHPPAVKQSKKYSGHSLAPVSAMTTSASVENIFAEVFVLVIVASVDRFGQFAHCVSFVGASSTVVFAAFVFVREVVTVVVTTNPAFETVIAKADGVVVVVVVDTRNEIIDGAYGRTVADENIFVLDACCFHIAILSVVMTIKENVVTGDVSNEFVPSGVESEAFKVLVKAVAKESTTGVSFHDFLAVFVFDREVTVEGLSGILVIVTESAGKALVVYFNPVRTVFQCT